MHLAVQQGVDKINSLQADMLLPEEIDIELNKSMFKFINTKYGRNNIYRKGFEQSQKRIDDLKKNDPNNIGISAHESSRDGAKSTAMLSLGVTIGSLAYGYFTGVFSEE